MWVWMVMASSWAMPPADAAWTVLSEGKEKIECTDQGAVTWCRSTGLVTANVDTIVGSLRDMAKNASLFEGILSIRTLEENVMHITLDFPGMLSDRDYVAQYEMQERPNGSFALVWTPTVHPNAPHVKGVVRLDDYAGEWQLEPAGSNTRVTYLWHASYGGSLPNFALPLARKKTGEEALKDIAVVNGAKVISP